MRLHTSEIEANKHVTRAVFGEKATVSLFGSRVNDQKKGGDIDLFIQTHRRISRAELYRLKILFLVQLKKIIGDQKIDVLIEGLQTREICETIAQERILL